jgi:putative hydrolase of the HAD superfamily
MIKLIIFDVGGVILHFNDDIYKRMLSKKFKISYKELSTITDPLLVKMDIGKATLKDLEKALHKNFGISKRDMAWNDTYKSIARVDKEMIALIERLSKRYKIAMLTNTCRSRYVYALNRFINKGLFDGRFASCYLGMKKPDACIFHHVLRMMRSSPHGAVFIDNMAENVRGARRIGIRSIKFENHRQLVRELKSLGVSA